MFQAVFGIRDILSSITIIVKVESSFFTGEEFASTTTSTRSKRIAQLIENDCLARRRDGTIFFGQCGRQRQFCV